MKRAITILSLVLIPAVTLAQDPATRAAERTRVLITPFESLSGGDGTDENAIARTMQRSLVVDLSRARDVRVIESEERAPDEHALLADAKARDVTYVVSGTVQMVEGRLRVTGRVLDTAKGEWGGQFKLTGGLRELFEMQDAVAERVLRHVTGSAPGADARDDGRADDAKAEVPDGQPLRVAPDRREPGWRDDRGATRDEQMARRYNYGYEPYWLVPYGYGYYGYGYNTFFSPYRFSRRPFYYGRVYDYTYHCLPNYPCDYGYGYGYGFNYYHRHPLRSFSGPVPLRWYRRS